MEELSIEIIEWLKKNKYQWPDFIVCHPETWENIMDKHYNHGSMVIQLTSAGEIKFKGATIYRSFDIKKGEFKIG
jgi:hypothetical protein